MHAISNSFRIEICAFSHYGFNLNEKKWLFIPLSCFKSIYMHLGTKIGSDIYLLNLWLPTTFLFGTSIWQQQCQELWELSCSVSEAKCMHKSNISCSLSLKSILIYSTICPYAVSFLNYTSRNIFLKRDIVKSSIEKYYGKQAKSLKLRLEFK